MKISIIVPVYNGEKFLDKTITSLLNQPYEDIELILVNDGSTDDSLFICQKYADNDLRVHIVNKNNSGISGARNAGIQVARGEYISFIDQDDEIMPNIYTDLIAGYDEKIDWVISGKIMKLIDMDNTVLKDKKYQFEERLVVEYADILKMIFNVNRDTCTLHLWNCLYKRTIIKKNEITFDSSFKYGHEDSLFNVEYAAHCKKIHVIPGIVYQYYRRASVSTSLKNNESYISDFEHYARVSNEALKLYNCNVVIKNIFFTYLLRLGIGLFKQYSHGDKSIRKKELNRIYNISCDVSGTNVISSCGMNKFYAYYLRILAMLQKKGIYSAAVYAIDILIQ